jgi:cytochrome c biogenesis protein CcdA
VPGAAGSFELSYDSRDDEGITRRGYIVNTDIAGTKPLYYLLTGVVREENGASTGASSFESGGTTSTPPPASGSEFVLRYYYTPGCRSCEEFLSTEIPSLESRYGVRVKVERRDLLDTAVYEELESFAASDDKAITAVPDIVIGKELLQGDAEIRDRLPGLLLTRAGAETPNPVVTSRPIVIVAKLSALPIMAAGIIDGLNPCAFTTLIFLLASLALAGRGRREVLVIGILFTLSVFLTYLGVGLGLFAALRAASGVALVSLILRWVLVAVLLVFAFLSIYDYVKIREGRPSEILLQLPNSLKLKIHASIRNRAKTAALAGSSLVMGFLVSIFEFACTAQVYLPTLAYLARGKGRTDALFLLLLYNLCFIAPLIVVFIASYLGVSSKRITLLFQRRLRTVKLGLAIVFLGLAVLTLIT